MKNKLFSQVHKNSDSAYLLHIVSKVLRDPIKHDSIWKKEAFVISDSANEITNEILKKYEKLIRDETTYESDFEDDIYSIVTTQEEESYIKGMIGGFKLCTALFSGDETTNNNE